MYRVRRDKKLLMFQKYSDIMKIVRIVYCEYRYYNEKSVNISKRLLLKCPWFQHYGCWTLSGSFDRFLLSKSNLNMYEVLSVELEIRSTRRASSSSMVPWDFSCVQPRRPFDATTRRRQQKYATLTLPTSWCTNRSLRKLSADE